MNVVSGARSWEIELPSDWEVSPSEWWPGFTAHRDGAALRVLWTKPGDISSDWTGDVIRTNQELGRCTGTVAYGPWSGHLIEAEDEGRWYRSWLLRAGAAQIEVSYGCPATEAGLDDPAIHRMLGSLTTLAGRPR